MDLESNIDDFRRLIAATQDENESVQKSAVETLTTRWSIKDLAGEEGEVHALIACFKHGSLEVRLDAAEALGRDG
jgi:HEAT repeat protein